ncbi:MAG: 16S rRNA (uracil(1498)-N(3))-methyltransferase [Candidatus Atribacteria bacterium]|nr:16S rRNA (uracil(1498)-N(3))-methyltransferase [Candidatus Atribacteria bacterium]
MTYPYFFTSSDNIKENSIVITGNDFNHLVNVLRVRTGDYVEISDNNRYRYMAEVTSIGKSEVGLKINKKIEIIRGKTGILLFQCILKREAMELAIQKTAEIGIESIIPVFSERVILDKEKIKNKVLRWQLIAEQASKQCKSDFICKVLPPANIAEIDPSAYETFFIPYESPSIENKDNFNAIEKYVFTNKKNKGRIAYLIGPEGGFDEKEIEMLSGKGSILINFGKNILRAETASIYFLSILDYLIKRDE